MNGVPGAVRLEGRSPCAHVIVADPGPSGRHYRVAVMSDRIENTRVWPMQDSLEIRACHSILCLRRPAYDQRRRYAVSRLSCLARDE
jgi:hypothetical protein